MYYTDKNEQQNVTFYVRFSGGLKYDFYIDPVSVMFLIKSYFSSIENNNLETV